MERVVRSLPLSLEGTNLLLIMSRSLFAVEFVCLVLANIL